MEVRNIIDCFHKTKCRVCCSDFSDHAERVKVSETIKERFFQLTQKELVSSEDLSSIICTVCDKSLRDFCKFKDHVIQIQENLEQFTKHSNDAICKEEFMWDQSIVSITKLEEVKSEPLEQMTEEEIGEDNVNMIEAVFSHNPSLQQKARTGEVKRTYRKRTKRLNDKPIDEPISIFKHEHLEYAEAIRVMHANHELFLDSYNNSERPETARSKPAAKPRKKRSHAEYMRMYRQKPDQILKARSEEHRKKNAERVRRYRQRKF